MSRRNPQSAQHHSAEGPQTPGQSPAVQGWMALVSAVEQLAAAHALSDIIDIVRRTARAISSADGVTFVLRDGERCHYVDEDAIAPLWKGRRFPMKACIAGWCMMHDKTAVVTDVFNDERVPSEAYRPTFIKSMVLVPLRTHEPVGAIGFYWGRNRSFAVEDLALIEALGRSASAAFAAVKAQDALRESEHRLALALEAGGMGAFELTLESGGIDATPSCKAWFGKAPQDSFNRDDLLAAIHPDDREQAALVLAAGPQPRRDAVYRLLAGPTRIELVGRRELDANGIPIAITGVVRDVTERFEAEERHDALLSQLLRAARLNDLGAMASALAHELNQPLAAGTNYLKAAERLLAKDPVQAISAISKAGGQFIRTKDIIQRIRGFVGQGQSLKTREDIEQLCHDVLELVRVTTSCDGTQVYLKVETGLPKIDLDKVQIQQVLFNLIRNAVEAMDGQILRQVTLSVARAEDSILFRVTDSGPGLAPEIAAHLFMPFHTTKEGGMGVGLSLCRKIAEGHGGKLWHEAGENPGATFCLRLPLG
ncbi:MAG: ATP-binding protein [Rhizomicrobium sp.]|nr:ATP-binding protein [Rhizomicrobium sp.]